MDFSELEQSINPTETVEPTVEETKTPATTTDEVVDESKETVEPTPATPVAEPDYKVQVAELRGQLEAVREQLNSVATAQRPKPVEEPPKKEEPLFESGQLLDVLEDETKFLGMMQRFAEKVERATTERILRGLPDVVSGHIVRHNTMQEEVKKFYDSNPELVEVKQFVVQVANKVNEEHPEWDVPKVFAETAIRAKKALGLNVKPTEAAARPAFTKPGQQTKNNSTDTVPQKEKEILDLLNFNLGGN